MIIHDCPKLLQRVFAIIRSFLSKPQMANLQAMILALLLTNARGQVKSQRHHGQFGSDWSGMCAASRTSRTGASQSPLAGAVGFGCGRLSGRDWQRGDGVLETPEGHRMVATIATDETSLDEWIIVSIHEHRWNIEVLFKELRGNLRMDTWHAYH